MPSKHSKIREEPLNNYYTMNKLIIILMNYLCTVIQVKHYQTDMVLKTTICQRWHDINLSNASSRGSTLSKGFDEAYNDIFSDTTVFFSALVWEYVISRLTDDNLKTVMVQVFKE